MYDFMLNITEYVSFFSQILAIVVIVSGMAKAFFTFVKKSLLGEAAREAIRESRLEIGLSFSLGLGFLIGASIIKSTVAPTWNEIGQLAAIIAIRTVLNYFLMKDIEKFQKM